MFGVTSASGWYGVLETKFIFLPMTISTRKKTKMYKIIVFTTLDFRQWRGVIPESQERNWADYPGPRLLP
jgi:hypothetical protein